MAEWITTVAVALPETIRTVEVAVCGNCKGDLQRVIPLSGDRGVWWHEATGLVNCPKPEAKGNA